MKGNMKEWKRKIAGLLCCSLVMTQSGITSFAEGLSRLPEAGDKVITEWEWAEERTPEFALFNALRAESGEEQEAFEPELFYNEENERWEIAVPATASEAYSEAELFDAIKGALPKSIKAKIYEEEPEEPEAEAMLPGEETVVDSGIIADEMLPNELPEESETGEAEDEAASEETNAPEAEEEIEAPEAEEEETETPETGEETEEADTPEVEEEETETTEETKPSEPQQPEAPEETGDAEEKEEDASAASPSVAAAIGLGGVKVSLASLFGFGKTASVSEADQQDEEDPEDEEPKKVAAESKTETESPEAASGNKTAGRVEKESTDSDAEEGKTRTLKLTWNAENQLEELEKWIAEALGEKSAEEETDEQNDDLSLSTPSFTERKEFTLCAELVKDGYAFAPNVALPEVTVALAETDYLEENAFDEFIIETVTPENATVNLFDYWITGENDPDATDENGNPISNTASNAVQWIDEGINNGHWLLFGKDMKPETIGKWNQWIFTKKNEYVSGNYKSDIAGVENLVKNKLEDGYPKLNLASEKFTEQIANAKSLNKKLKNKQSESLAYLFDPETENKARNAYQNVQGLFQYDEKTGGYYYNSSQNFAVFRKSEEKEESSGYFDVYNTWGVATGGQSPNGQFFPFNKAAEVFALDENNQITQKKVNGEFLNSKNKVINHYLGFTMEVDFQQPVGGRLSNEQDMIFEFSGDDDVWIFIDDVLVADLGGQHDRQSVSINFANGTIKKTGYRYNPNADVKYVPVPVENQGITNLRDAFKKVYDENSLSSYGFAESSNTFSANSFHTLKFFYLERGNVDSNMSLNFNLMPPRASEIVKYDQSGNPIAGVSFELYATGGDYSVDEDATLILSGTTDSDGQLPLKDKSDKTIDFSMYEGEHFVLRETDSREGYRGTQEIHLKYNGLSVANDNGKNITSNLLVVDDEQRWEVGAVANASAVVTSQGAGLVYGTQAEITGGESTDEEDKKAEIEGTKAKAGLIVVVPLINAQQLNLGNKSTWVPLWGSVLEGFQYEVPENSNQEAMRKAVLKAALKQLYYSEKKSEQNYRQWTLDWDADSNQYSGTLSDLPGDIERYYWVNSAGDLTMAYYFLDWQSLDSVLGIVSEDATAEAKRDVINDKIENLAKGATEEAAIDTAIDTLADKILSVGTKPFGLLSSNNFARQFYTRILVPNYRNELRVKKVDTAGDPLAGATFGIFESVENAQSGEESITTGVTDENGLLIFTPDEGAYSGVATAQYIFKTPEAENVVNTYYLKELSAPNGYVAASEIIPVRVTREGVYADALAPDDNISVNVYVGKLAQTMTRYAAGKSVNATLRDITATAETKASGDFADSKWKTEKESKNFHYNLNNDYTVGQDYGLHAEDMDKDIQPYFTTESGYLRITEKQNLGALETEETRAKYEDLNDKDISGLFANVTEVVVKNEEVEKSILSVTKKVEGPANGADVFDFTLKLTWSDGEPVADGIYGDVKFVDGKTTFKLRENKTKKFTGLPVGAKYELSENLGDKAGRYEEPKITPQTGEIKANGNVTITATNTAKTGALSVTKTVASGDKAKEFKFEVELKWPDATAVTGEYTATKTSKDEKADESVKSVTFDENGKATFSLSDQERLTIKGLPAGTSYTVTESAEGYTVEYTGNTGEIKADETAEVTVTNTIKTGSLLIDKTVTGSGNKKAAFEYSLELQDQNGKPLAGSYAWTKSGANVAADESKGSIGSSGTFTLKDGQTITIKELPYGAKYKVTETDAKGHTAYVSYGTVETQTRAAEGTIKEGGNTVHYRNNKSGGGGGNPPGGGGGGGTPPGGGGGNPPGKPVTPEPKEETPGYIPPHPEYNNVPVMGDTQFGPGFVNTTTNQVTLDNTREVIPQLKDLHAQNNELEGWLTVVGTGFGYPVMYSPNNPTYYQHRTFNRTLDGIGIPFLAPYCDGESMNVLIHGHNMKDVSQFGYIWNYRDPAFRAKNPTIDFKTLYDANGQYEVMAVFMAPVYKAEETGVFKWYQYHGNMNKNQFDYYVQNVKALSLYDTGVTAEYGDQLITLETCASTTDSTRLVVVARKKGAIAAKNGQAAQADPVAQQ